MKLTLIRHSQTVTNPEIPVPQWGLSEEGINLAKSLSREPIIKGIEVIYSSLQTKALETAVLLSKALGIPIKTNDGLTEITSFTIKFLSDYEEKFTAFYDGEIMRINGGESIQEGVERVLMALESIIAHENNADNIGIVSHGHILSFFSAKYYDQPPRQIHEQMKMPDVAVIDWDKKQFIKFYGESI